LWPSCGSVYVCCVDFVVVYFVVGYDYVYDFDYDYFVYDVYDYDCCVVGFSDVDFVYVYVCCFDFGCFDFGGVYVDVVYYDFDCSFVLWCFGSSCFVGGFFGGV